MDKALKILLLEDNPMDAELLQRELKRADFQFQMEVVDTRDEFVKGLFQLRPDLIISDHSLPQFNSLEALEITKDYDENIPFILVTGTVSEEFAVECMKAGIDDYILKESLKRLPGSIRNAFSRKKIMDEKHVIEKLNRDLTDSITYAKRIQEAILFSSGLLKKHFPQSFMLHSPKDIVSGDFFWYAEHEGRSIFAVVDCTGHGVPGAFMSVIGYSILNDIVYVKGITQPAKILARLNIAIREALRQDTEKSTSCDGMDIAVCSINRKNNLFEFAGANRPLWFARNKNLEILKGNPVGIGGIHLHGERKFQNHSMKLSTLSHLYLFTDGYTDQFGGPEGEKLMTRNLFKLLSENMDRSMEDQKQVLTNTLMLWKGELPQTDDILVTGIRL